MGDSKLVLTATCNNTTTTNNNNSGKNNLPPCDTCCIPAFLLKWFKKKSSKKSLDLNGNESSKLQTKSSITNSFLLSSVTLKQTNEFDPKCPPFDQSTTTSENTLSPCKVISVVPSENRRPSILVNGSRKSSLVPGGLNSSSQFKKRVSFGNVLEQREYHPETDSEPDHDVLDEKLRAHLKESNVDFYD